MMGRRKGELQMDVHSCEYLNKKDTDEHPSVR